MRLTISLRCFASVVLAAAFVACAPPPPDDAGTSDDAGELPHDAGDVDAGHDAGHDAGEQPPLDGGGSGECPTIGEFSNPEGDPCTEEGKVCRESGCLAPGPGCLFIQCHNGVWMNQAFIDAGPPGTDAGEAEPGDETDAGDEDVDAGESDAG